MHSNFTLDCFAWRLLKAIKNSVFMKDNEDFLKWLLMTCPVLFLTLAANPKCNNLEIAYHEPVLYLCLVFQNTDTHSPSHITICFFQVYCYPLKHSKTTCKGIVTLPLSFLIILITSKNWFKTTIMAFNEHIKN